MCQMLFGSESIIRYDSLKRILEDGQSILNVRNGLLLTGYTQW